MELECLQIIHKKSNINLFSRNEEHMQVGSYGKKDWDLWRDLVVPHTCGEVRAISILLSCCWIICIIFFLGVLC